MLARFISDLDTLKAQSFKPKITMIRSLDSPNKNSFPCKQKE